MWLCMEPSRDIMDLKERKKKRKEEKKRERKTQREKREERKEKRKRKRKERGERKEVLMIVYQNQNIIALTFFQNKSITLD